MILSRTNIKSLSQCVGIFGLGPKNIGADDIGNVGIVARLITIAINGLLCSNAIGFHKFGDMAGIGALRILSRTIDVEIAKRDGFHAIEQVEETGIFLSNKLLQSIWRDGASSHRFDKRNMLIPINGRT